MKGPGSWPFELYFWQLFGVNQHLLYIARMIIAQQSKNAWPNSAKSIKMKKEYI
jgi:hypothetical protein